MKPYLILKPVDTARDETNRIYSHVKNTVEDFNNYVSDFFESVVIISEKRETLQKTGVIQEAAKCEEEIKYLRGCIIELRQSMLLIAAAMDSLVEYGERE